MQHLFGGQTGAKNQDRSLKSEERGERQYQWEERSEESGQSQKSSMSKERGSAVCNFGSDTFLLFPKLLVWFGAVGV